MRGKYGMIGLWKVSCAWWFHGYWTMEGESVCWEYVVTYLKAESCGYWTVAWLVSDILKLCISVCCGVLLVYLCTNKPQKCLFSNLFSFLLIIFLTCNTNFLHQAILKQIHICIQHTQFFNNIKYYSQRYKTYLDRNENQINIKYWSKIWTLTNYYLHRTRLKLSSALKPSIKYISKIFQQHCLNIQKHVLTHWSLKLIANSID